MLTAQAPIKLPPLIRRPAVVRLLLIALFAEVAYAVLNINTMPVYLQRDRQFGESLIGLVIAAFLLSEAVFKGPMGHLADRYGARTFMILGPAMSCCTALLSLAVPNEGGSLETLAFITLRMLDGLGAAMLWPATFALMGNTVADSERQQGMSLLNTCYLLGIALALPVGGFVEDIFRSHAAGLYLAAIFFVGVAVAGYFLIKRDVHHGASEAGEVEGFHIREFITVFRKIPAYVVLAIVTFTGIGFPLVILKLFALDEFNLTALQFGALVFPGAVAMAAMGVPMSRLGDKLGNHRAVHIGMGLCSAGLIFISLGAFFPFLRSAWALALGGIPLGLGFLLAIPAWLTSVSDLDCRRRAAYLGAVMTAQGLGAIIGAPLGGLMYEKLVPLGEDLGFGKSFGHYSPFMGCAIAVTIGWLLSLKILKNPEAKPQPSEPEDAATVPGVGLPDGP